MNEIGIITIAIFLILLLAAGIRMRRLSAQLKVARIDAAEGRFLRECTSNGFLEIGRDGEIFNVNPAVSEFLNTDPENLIGRNLADTEENGGIPDLFRLILNAAEESGEGRCSSFKYEFADPRGDSYSAEMSVRVLPARSGGERRILCVSRDALSPRDAKTIATRRLQLEELLGTIVSKAFSTIDTEDNISSILGLAGAFLEARRGFLFELNEHPDQLNWRAIWDNENVCEFDKEWLELTPAIVKRFLYSDSDDFLVIRNFADNPRLSRRFRQLARRNDVVSVVVTRLAAHGEQCTGYAGFTFSWSEPFIGESEAVLLKVLSETLTGVLAKSLADKQKRLYKQCVEEAAQGIAIIDGSGFLYYANNAYRKITGHAGKDTVPVWKYYHGSYEDKVEKFILPLVRGGTRWSGELAIKQGRNQLNTLESFFSIEQSGTALPLVVNIVTNINAQKRLEKQLTEARKAADSANREKSDYLANMSHEIRTPMNAILGLSYLSLQNTMSSRQRDYMTKINSAAHNLLSIINSILDLSRIESGKLELEQAVFTIDAVLENLANLTLERAVEKNNVLLFRRSFYTNGKFLGDALRIGQILLNLVGNAIKFTENGSVVVSVEQARPGYIRFSVTDTGIGISADRMKKLFEPFSQADAATSRKYGGSGLGLAISKQLAELMGGSIQAESRPDSGSCFSFEIHLDRPGESHTGETAPGDEILLPARLKNSPALCIAADSLKREIHGTALQSLGFQVSSCSSIKQALESPGQPRLILLDTDTCSGSCSEAVSAMLIGEDPRPILIISGSGGYAALEQAVAPELYRHLLPLPYSYRQLGTAVLDQINEPAENGKEDAGQDAGKTIVKGRILLAEDDKINQQVATELLSRTGLDVDIAEDGRQAVQMCRDNTYNLVLMDIHMPYMSGYESASAIRRENPALPIIAITASAMSSIRSQLRDSAFNDCLTKPIDPDELYQTVGKAFAIPAALLKRQWDLNARNEKPALNIPGLNEQAGLDVVLGNRSRYHQILKHFTDSFSGFSSDMNSRIQDGNPSRIVEKLHELRGAAAGIGAEEIHSLAGRLEDRTRADSDIDTSKIRRLSDKLDNLVREIRKKQLNPPTNTAVGQLRNQFLDELENLVRRGSSEALTRLENHSVYINEPEEYKRVEQMRSALIRTDYDSALNLIDEWRLSGGME